MARRTKTRSRRDSRPRATAVTPSRPAADAESSDTIAVSLHGKLALRRDALTRLRTLLDRRPHLATVVRIRLGRVRVPETILVLTAAEWHRLHKELLFCASLAHRGSVAVSCDQWETCIHATGRRAAPAFAAA